MAGWPSARSESSSGISEPRRSTPSGSVSRTIPTLPIFFGAVSLIVWYLLAIVTLKYVYFLLRLDNHGEGGVFALLALAKLNAPKQKWLVYTLIAGAGLLYGDGIITPAISVLSAVEGLAPPTINNVVNPEAWANPWIASLILAALFAVQRYGTDKISKAFAPIMLGWFSRHRRHGYFPHHRPSGHSLFAASDGWHFLSIHPPRRSDDHARQRPPSRSPARKRSTRISVISAVQPSPLAGTASSVPA